MTEFGRNMLKHWVLDPEVTFLNHGTVGATPRRVLDKQQEIRMEIEKQPAAFMLRDWAGLVGMPRETRLLARQAADSVSRFVGARGDDFFFVPNATTGINSVLRSLRYNPGDDILILDHAYGAIANTVAYVARERGVRVNTVHLPYPVVNPSEIVAAIVKGITSHTRVAVIDHITSETALILPLEEIIAACHKLNVPVLVDGAHTPGVLPLDLSEINADWYVGNLHKWAHAPRSCGFLWVRPDRHEGIHPSVISWGLDKGLAAEFDWTGTLDPTAQLAAPTGIEMIEEFDFRKVREYTHDLAWKAVNLLSERLGTELGMRESMVGSMATVLLPQHFGSSKEDASRLRDKLLFQEQIEVQVTGWQDRLWLRISAQVYNEMSDISRLAEALDAVSRQRSAV